MTSNTNPGNFANRPTEEVKASHGGHSSTDDPSSGGTGGQHSAATDGRNPDGTFTKGSAAAKEAGHIGGSTATTTTERATTSSSGSSGPSGSTSSAGPGRNADGTFTKGSEAAKEAGHKGGSHS
ncbi:hypothetical protein B0A49_05772 [Cryomyces minteri]|uniref:Conidiation-specific protein 10 n=1 Tax=Cryomyces minteri TaxID=331657 RepID=A0A4U0WTI5_9PEZI|nr:hypothetical protein B0A49_05772 [Cryomyces minteri]